MRAIMPGMTRPFAQSCENNQAPIFEVLQHAFADRRHVLEIGTGTGQHSVYFAPRLPHLVWQTSELPALHAGIAAWHADFPAPNLRLPVALDLSCSSWPQTEDGAFDAVFTSNTLHIVAWPLVERLFALLDQHLPAGGVFAAYGPFNYGGRFTSDSNCALTPGSRRGMQPAVFVTLRPWRRWLRSMACSCRQTMPCPRTIVRWCFRKFKQNWPLALM